MRIIDLIEQRPPIAIGPDDEVALAMQTMLWAEVRHLPVVKSGGVLGVLSEHDTLVVLARSGRRTRVQEAMSAPAVVIEVSADAELAAAIMLERRIGCLPVLDDGALVGMVTRTDIVRLQAGEVPAVPTRGARVEAVMTIDPATTASESRLLDAAALMKGKGVRHLPVIDGERRVVGMLSDGDVRLALGDALRNLRADDAVVRLDTKKVADAMTPAPYTMERTAPLADAAMRLADHRIGAIPIVDVDQRLVGIVSYVDVLRALVEQ
jgi:CBS domain-containing protein